MDGNIRLDVIVQVPVGVLVDFRFPSLPSSDLSLALRLLCFLVDFLLSRFLFLLVSFSLLKLSAIILSRLGDVLNSRL